jgi:hypothetical protein
MMMLTPCALLEAHETELNECDQLRMNESQNLNDAAAGFWL